MDAVVIAGQEGKPVQFDFEVADKVEEDPYKLLRIIGISTAVTIGIVLARTPVSQEPAGHTIKYLAKNLTNETPRVLLL